jgi:adenylate cyclase
VAARLQALAEPGGILISGAVFDHVKDKLAVSFDALGHKAIKNISAQVPVYRVVLEPGQEVTPAIAPLMQESADPPAGSRESRLKERRHRFVMSTVTTAAFIAFFFAINLFTGGISEGEVWFQWPSLAFLFVYALRTIVLFRKVI